mgnify:CR=1 FL=1
MVLDKKQKSLAFSEIFSFQCFAGIDRKFKKDETDILLPAQCRLGQSTQRRVECSTTAAQSFLVTFLVTFLEMLPAAAPVLPVIAFCISYRKSALRSPILPCMQ